VGTASDCAGGSVEESAGCGDAPSPVLSPSAAKAVILTNPSRIIEKEIESNNLGFIIVTPTIQWDALFFVA
jgi:hypothetical protein